MINQSQLESAQAYASIGWYVFPVSASKAPLVTGGFKAASIDSTQITAWWTAHPDARIGVACGKSRIFAVDLDRNHGNARDGVQAWEFAQQDFGDDNSGITATTPKGGRHLIYRHPGKPIKNVSNVIPDSGIDVRGEGGYIVAPSPIEPKRDWEDITPFDENEDGTPGITMAPQWVLDIVLVPEDRPASTCVGLDAGKVMTMSDLEVARIRSALTHVRNDDYDKWVKVGMALKSTFAKSQAYNLWAEWSALDYIGFDDSASRTKWLSFREFRMDGTEVALGTLFHMARDNGWIDTSDTPLEDVEPADEASGIVEAVKDRDLPFPSELLNMGGLLGDMAHYITTSAPYAPQPALGFGASLAVVSGIMGSIVRTEGGSFSHLYICGLGSTGCGKNAGKNFVGKMMNLAGCGDAMAADSWTSDAALRNELAAEKQTSINAKYGRTSSIDEFGMWLQATNDKANMAKGSMKKLFMETWSADAETVIMGQAYANDAERPRVDLTGPCLTVYGCSTPGIVYEALGDTSVVDGLANRILYIRVDQEVPYPASEEPMSFRISRDKLEKKLLEMTAMVRPAGGFATAAMGTYEPIIASYGDGVQERLDKIKVDLDAVRREELGNNSSSLEGGLWVRVPEMIRRVATVMAVSEMSTVVSHENVKHAEIFVTWCTRKTVAEMAISDTGNAYEDVQKRILRMLDDFKGEQVPRARISKRLRKVSKRDRNDALEHLVEAGDITQHITPVGPKGGTPKTSYTLRHSDS